MRYAGMFRVEKIFTAVFGGAFYDKDSKAAKRFDSQSFQRKICGCTAFNAKLYDGAFSAFLMPSQNSSTLFPIGVTAPIPVTTTLFISFSFQKTIYPFSTYHINMYRRNAHCTISPVGSMLVSHYAGMYKHIPSQCSLYHLVFKPQVLVCFSFKYLFLFQNIHHLSDHFFILKPEQNLYSSGCFQIDRSILLINRIAVGLSICR